MRKYLVLFFALLFLSSCEQDILLIEEGKEAKVKEKQSDQFTLKKANEAHALIYLDNSLQDKNLINIKRPIINLNSEYAKSLNDHLKLRASETLSELKKDNGQAASMDYESFENDGFISLLIKQSIGGKQKYYAYNIDTSDGGPLTIDEVDKRYGYNGKLQGLIEKNIIKSSEKDTGTALQKFWDLEYKGYPQLYVDNDKLYAILNSDSGDKLLVIEKDTSFEDEAVNQLYSAMNNAQSFDLQVVSLGQVEGSKEAKDLAVDLIGQYDSHKEPSFLNFEDTGGRAYLLIAKKENTLLRAKSLDKQTGLTNEDMTNPNPYYLDDSYLIIFPDGDKDYQLALELVYRANKVNFSEEDLNNEALDNKMKITIMSKDSE